MKPPPPPSVKPRKRARKPPAVPSVKPHDCVVLAVDTARQSGWCVVARGKYHSSGEVNATNPGQLEALVSHAMGACMDAGLNSMQFVLVLERPTHGNRRTLVGLGESHGAWKAAWVRSHGRKCRIVAVPAVTWRSRVLGNVRGPALPLLEKEHARRFKGSIDVGPNEAAACGIAKWASHAGEVGKVLPKRVRAGAEGG